MSQYWLGEIERVLDGVHDVPFGRIATDDVRIGGRRPSPPGSCTTGSTSLTRRSSMANADPDRLARAASTRSGELKSPAWRPFIVGHLEAHVAQLEAILADRPPRMTASRDPCSSSCHPDRDRRRGAAGGG
jgi:hypothetical protein